MWIRIKLKLNRRHWMLSILISISTNCCTEMEFIRNAPKVANFDNELFATFEILYWYSHLCSSFTGANEERILLESFMVIGNKHLHLTVLAFDEPAADREQEPNRTTYLLIKIANVCANTISTWKQVIGLI